MIREEPKKTGNRRAITRKRPKVTENRAEVTRNNPKSPEIDRKSAGSGRHKSINNDIFTIQSTVRFDIAESKLILSVCVLQIVKLIAEINLMVFSTQYFS